mmetsp:Transcript_28023/g.90910  ORF Transcript_28023/g.90910 Transcript_28023/m.90910 type:complete len:208 (+) Transcript_28023:402-1025(+)
MHLRATSDSIASSSVAGLSLSAVASWQRGRNTGGTLESDTRLLAALRSVNFSSLSSLPFLSSSRRLLAAFLHSETKLSRGMTGGAAPAFLSALSSTDAGAGISGSSFSSTSASLTMHSGVVSGFNRATSSSSNCFLHFTSKYQFPNSLSLISRIFFTTLSLFSLVILFASSPDEESSFPIRQADSSRASSSRTACSRHVSPPASTLG